MPGPKYVTCGGLRVDYLITRGREARSGLPGGNALYAAAGAAFWTDEVALLARYGSSYPQHWLRAFSTLNLQTGGLVRVAGDHDHRTFYAYTPDGRREDTNPALHYARLGLPLPPALAGYQDSTPQQDDPYQYEPLAPRPGDWPENFSGVTVVHLSPLPLATHLHLPAVLHAQNVGQITIDPGERYMIPTIVSASLVVEGYGALYALQLGRDLAEARLATVRQREENA